MRARLGSRPGSRWGPVTIAVFLALVVWTLSASHSALLGRHSKDDKVVVDVPVMQVEQEEVAEASPVVVEPANAALAPVDPLLSSASPSQKPTRPPSDAPTPPPVPLRGGEAVFIKSPDRAKTLRRRSPGNYQLVVVTVWSIFQDMMEPQIRSLLHFCAQDAALVYVVVNSAHTEDRRINVDNKARSVHSDIGGDQFDMYYMRTTCPQSRIFHPSFAHADSLNQAKSFLLDNNLLDERDVLFLLDVDMFPTKHFPSAQLMANYSVVSSMSARGPVEYIWPNFAIFNLRNFVKPTHPPVMSIVGDLDFTNTVYRGHATDTGGKTVFWIQKYPRLIIKNGTKEECGHFKPGDEFFQVNKRLATFMYKQCRVPLGFQCRRAEALGLPFTPGGLAGTGMEFYHIGSGGSLWRGCNDTWRDDRRFEIIEFVNSIIGTPLGDSDVAREKDLVDASGVRLIP